LFDEIGLDDYAERHRQAAQPPLSSAESIRVIQELLPNLRSVGDRQQLIDILTALCNACVALEDWAGLATAANELIDLGAVDAETWVYLADARANLNDEAGAADAYAQALALQPQSAMLRRNFANTLIHLGRLDEAAVQLAAAEQLEPDAPYLALRCAELAQARGDAADAMRWAQVALQRQPDWDEAQAILAWAQQP
jgi:tetratricopeptide (TPR) repeat protein